jgi:hypothetical protein
MQAILQTFLADPAAGAARLFGEAFGGGTASVVLAVAAALLLTAIWWWRRSVRKGPTSVIARRAFSHAEGLLWARVNAALPEQVVLMSVPLTRFITVRQAGGLGRNQRKLEPLTVDLALMRTDGTVSAVVILEDGENVLTRRQAKLRRKLLERAGIKTVNWTLKPLPSAEVIARQLNPAGTGYAAGERGSSQRSHRGSAVIIHDHGVAPDTRLVANHANPDFRPA